MPRAGRSHHRLFVAMGASSGLLAALLWAMNSLISFAVCSSPACHGDQEVMTVRLEKKKKNTIPLDDAPEHPVPVVPPVEEAPSEPQLADTDEPQVGVEEVEATAPPAEVTLKQDWHAIALETAAQVADARVKNEQARQKMWQQTRSVMFADTGELDVHEPAPLMDDLEFKVPVGVLGVGVTIGGCFIGIPLAGIPVEERTAEISIIYCKDQYQ